ncbi:MAG: PSD1 and planctomycete cytochrome C domain-containing protein [Pirellulaceae bacterium]
MYLVRWIVTSFLPMFAAIAASMPLANGYADEIDFDTQVRPILSDKCFHCHGPDEATRAAGLRLDTAEGAREDLGGYAAFKPSDEENSEGLRRILSDDADEVMPPPESKLSLSSAEKETLAAWIREGAKWSEHWSFVPPAPPTVPPDNSGWSRGEIDRFVLAKIRAKGMTPQAEASRETLIRRVSLDLTGIPPTPGEVDAFLSDQSPDAYEKVVDRLLQSPQYGQRMAWEWLDASRYADTDGFQGDPTRTMWPWRDWLVDALNDNMPFDQFTIEMLAGDLLPDATAEQILATGFNRNHMFNGEGGRIAEETRVENVFDRAETTGTIWLGLTMTCCRCHDHKYDPISQKEYFQLYAFFDNTSETGRSGRGKTEPIINYLSPELRQQRDLVAQQLSVAESEIAAPIAELDQQQSQWESEAKAAIADYKSDLKLGSWWKLGPIAKPGRKAFDADLGPEKKVDLEAAIKVDDKTELRWTQEPKLADGKVHELPGTVGATYFYRTLHTASKKQVLLSLGSDDAIKAFVNGKEVLSNFAARPAVADQELITIDLKAGDNDLLIKIVNTGGIGGFYFDKRKESVMGLYNDVIDALNTAVGKRKPAQRQLLQEHFRSQHWPQWKTLSQKRKELQQQLTQIDKQATTVMVMDNLPADKQRQTLILDRGGYDKPTEVAVKPGTPVVLPPLKTVGEESTGDRLALAQWLVDPANPLTARVTVNRYWQTFFGRGLVASTEDFGSQGSRPTHPELLDWLALKFIDSGWNVKEIHRQMVCSATYRQSSAVTHGAIEDDPENKWLARAPRFRMPSWMLRDQALAVSGLLNPAMGGPSVMPYQPDGIWAEATFGKIRYQQDTGDSLYRRSLYVFWRRIVGPTMFFDGSKRQTCEVKPTRTNTPLHALTTLNETTFVESARAMAQRVIHSEVETDERLQYAFRLVTSRSPTDEELAVLSDRVEKLRTDFTVNVDEAKTLLSVGQSPRDEQIDVAEHAAYVIVCSTLLNLDETLSRQ